MSISNSPPKIPPTLTDIEYYILIAILHRPRSGIGIFEQIATSTENQMILSPGTLYAALKRMYAASWIKMVDPAEAGYEPDERRKIYVATDEGAHVVEEKVAWFELEIVRARNELKKRNDTSSSGSSGEAPSSSDRNSASDTRKNKR
jgi:DNA-binding PadR family transcriptional regulator